MAYNGVMRSKEWIEKQRQSQKGVSRNKGQTNPFYGKTHTEESRKKMSLAHKGKKRPPRSPEWNRRISEARKGTMKGSQNPFWGKTHTPEVKKVLSERNKGNPNQFQNGDKNPNWKGGITNPRQSKSEKVFSRAVLKRDKFTCQECGVKKTSDNPLQAHHKKAFVDNPTERFDISNGITLCRKCHILTDSYGGKNHVQNRRCRDKVDNFGKSYPARPSPAS